MSTGIYEELRNRLTAVHEMNYAKTEIAVGSGGPNYALEVKRCYEGNNAIYDFSFSSLNNKNICGRRRVLNIDNHSLYLVLEDLISLDERSKLDIQSRLRKLNTGKIGKQSAVERT